MLLVVQFLPKYYRNNFKLLANFVIIKLKGFPAKSDGQFDNINNLLIDQGRKDAQGGK